VQFPIFAFDSVQSHPPHRRINSRPYQDRAVLRPWLLRSGMSLPPDFAGLADRTKGLDNVNRKNFSALRAAPHRW